MEQSTVIQKAIDSAGSQQRLAELANISQQHISKLLRNERGVTAEIAVAIERATGGDISRSDLRPDLWPRTPEQAA